MHAIPGGRCTVAVSNPTPHTICQMSQPQAPKLRAGTPAKPPPNSDFTKMRKTGLASWPRWATFAIRHPHEAEEIIELKFPVLLGSPDPARKLVDAAPHFHFWLCGKLQWDPTGAGKCTPPPMRFQTPALHSNIFSVSKTAQNEFSIGECLEAANGGWHVALCSPGGDLPH